MNDICTKCGKSYADTSNTGSTYVPRYACNDPVHDSFRYKRIAVKDLEPFEDSEGVLYYLETDGDTVDEAIDNAIVRICEADGSFICTQFLCDAPSSVEEDMLSHIKWAEQNTLYGVKRDAHSPT